MAGYTAGPWKVGGGIGYSTGKPTVSIWGQTPPGKQSGEWIAQEVAPANAALIAAAPELLEALSEAVKLMPLGSTIRSAWVLKTLNLIAKAEGGVK